MEIFQLVGPWAGVTVDEQAGNFLCLFDENILWYITLINSFLSSFNSTLTYQGVMGQTRLGLHTFIGTIVTVWSDSDFIGLFMQQPALLYHYILP